MPALGEFFCEQLMRALLRLVAVVSEATNHHMKTLPWLFTINTPNECGAWLTG